MNQLELLKFYSRRDIQREIVKICKNREVAIKYGEKGYGKRPDTIQFENDILELAKKGATSFHISEEHWLDPLKLDVSMNKSQLDDLRIGWDFIIDIDSASLEHSKIVAALITDALTIHNIKNFSIKFSGNRGFHIGVPFSSFPGSINNQGIKSLFPDGAKTLAAYLQHFIKDDLKNTLKVSDPFSLVDIDTLLISNRHLFRSPFSFNEKSGLVSVPIKKEDILDFNIDSAKPENVTTNIKFLTDLENAPEEASSIFVEAFDWQSSQKIRQAVKTDLKEQRTYSTKEKAIFNEEVFPPCMQLGLKGLDDGKKRFIFISINFLRNMGWKLEDIESRLLDWNKLNKKPLRDNYISSQIDWFKKQSKAVLPPNCDHRGYMLGIGICKPDHFCKSIKNPVSYPERKLSTMRQAKPTKAKASSKK